MLQLPFPLTVHARRRALVRVLALCTLVALLVAVQWTLATEPVATRHAPLPAVSADAGARASAAARDAREGTSMVDL
jgi:hypothetical protein